MAIAARAAEKLGMCSQETMSRIHQILDLFGLPAITEYTVEDLFSFTLSDKKRSGGIVRLIVPYEIGRCEVVPLSLTELKSFIEAGL